MSDIEYKIEKVSLSRKVYLHIKSLILSGELKAGERIPEARIASRFGLSRTPIREALQRLEEYGLVQIKPRSYAQVATLPASAAEDIAALRATLEVLSVELFMNRNGKEDLQRLEQLAHQCEQHMKDGNIAEAFETDSEFHLAIAKGSGNEYVYEALYRLDSRIQLMRLAIHLPPDRLTQFIGQHRKILHALRSDDVDKCKELVRKHVLDQLKHYERVDSRPG